jgi:putative colanic acid biosynthesis glycosyltransferase
MLYSIITVCYNNLAGLLQTYESIKNQSFKDYEWIIVDGGSRDGTPIWLEQLQGENIVWRSEKDKGIFDAMNKGIDMSKGNYLLFMNSGDCLATNSILERVSVFTGESYNFIYGDSEDVTTSGNVLYKVSKPYTSLYRGMFASHQAMFFKSAVLEGQKYRWEEFPVTADYAFIAEFLSKCKKENIKYMNIPYCRFMLGGTNDMHRFKALHEDFRIRRDILKIGWLKSALLYCLHYIHTLLKKTFPLIMQKLRYK